MLLIQQQKLLGKVIFVLFMNFKTNIFHFHEQDLDSELNLRFVRIYFYATTFDIITKDRAAKFVDKLSAIGGTMGLLTGFSIISGVEIVYFGIKFILKALEEYPNNKKKPKELLKINA